MIRVLRNPLITKPVYLQSASGVGNPVRNRHRKLSQEIAGGGITKFREAGRGIVYPQRSRTDRPTKAGEACWISQLHCFESAAVNTRQEVKATQEKFGHPSVAGWDAMAGGPWYVHPRSYLVAYRGITLSA